MTNGKAQQQQKTPDVVYVSFSAEVNPTTCEGLLGACTDLANKGVKQVHLLLSTPGGSVTNGMNVYGVLRALPFELITHNVGSVDSIGNVIFLAGEKRYSNAEATFMFHGVVTHIQNASLGPKQMRESLSSLVADEGKIGKVIVDRTGFAKSRVEELFQQGSTVDAEYAKDNGIINDIRQAKVPTGVPILQLVFKR